jgi:hypothetical protein
MVLTHIAITRFSYNAGSEADGLVRTNRTTTDPLARHRLEKRFQLFELFCVPGIIGQTCRDFIWIFIVDSRLSDRDIDRLRALTRGHARTHVVKYSPGLDLGGLTWLRPYVDNPATTHIATTNIDDDDLVCTTLMEHIQQTLRQRFQAKQLPGCLVMASVNPPQWDFMPTREAPFGYLKPWHRGGFPTFAGFTVCCAQPAYDVSVLAFEHTLCREYFDPGATLDDVRKTQARLRASAERAGDDWRAWKPEEHIHIVRRDRPEVVVVNHLENDQTTRLFERWSTRRPVTGWDDFPGMTAAFDRVPAVIQAFRRSPTALLRFLVKATQLLVTPRGLKRREIIATAVTAPIWFVTGRREPRRPGAPAR